MTLQILCVSNPRQLFEHIAQTGCDPVGARIMSLKGLGLAIKIKALDSWQANILKQELLSLNADAAVSRGSITGKVKKTDCIVMGNLSQLKNLIEKLRRQPPSLKKIGGELKEIVENSQKEKFNLRAGSHNLRLGARTLIMGVINMTPDSFSGDGWLRLGWDYGVVAAFVEKMVGDGADIIDIGGESTRPGARPVSSKEEIRRVIPLIKRLIKTIKVPLSIDTYKPQVAKAALDAGAGMVNDIMGLKKSDPMLKVLKAFPEAAVVVMHIKGKPRTMQKNPVYADLMHEIISHLNDSLDAGLQAGINRDRFIVDPGIGFGKTKEHNLTILRRLGELKGLGRPVLIGTSRKSFIGKVLNLPEEKRIFGTAASVACAIVNGAHIVRVHDVKEMKNVVKLTDAIAYN